MTLPLFDYTSPCCRCQTWIVYNGQNRRMIDWFIYRYIGQQSCAWRSKYLPRIFSAVKTTQVKPAFEDTNMQIASAPESNSDPINTVNRPISTTSVVNTSSFSIAPANVCMVVQVLKDLVFQIPVGNKFPIWHFVCSLFYRWNIQSGVRKVNNKYFISFRQNLYLVALLYYHTYSYCR